MARVIPQGGGEAISSSPSGLNYAFSLVRSDLARGGNWLELYWGATNSIAAARPKRAARMFTFDLSSRWGPWPATYPLYHKLAWLSDRKIAFLWSDGKSPMRVIAVDLPSGTISDLINHATSINSFSVIGRDTYAFTAVPAQSPGKDSASGVFVDTASAYQFLVNPTGTAGVPLNEAQLFVQTRGEVHQVDVGHLRANWLVDFKPNSVGSGGVLMAPLSDGVPETWKAYEDSALRATITEFTADPGSGSIQALAYLDAEKARLRPILDAPISVYRRPEVLWGADDRPLIIGPTFLPAGLKSVRGTTGEALAAIDVTLGSVREIPLPQGATHCRPIRWIDGKTVRLTCVDASLDVSVPSTTDSRSQSGEGAVTEPFMQRADMKISIRQSMNDPPVLVATELKSGETTVLMKIAPELDKYRLARVETFIWEAADHRWEGRLYLPRGLKPKAGFPLLIQTHGAPSADVFALFGNKDNMGTGFAAQPMAARGIAVLQLPDIRGMGASPKEPQLYAQSYEAAIKILAARHIIDPLKVGLMGFSRTGWHVEYALTHGSFRYAAALAADNMTTDYVTTTLFGGNTGEYALDVGATSPTDYKAWLEQAPAFSISKLRTPLRLEADSGGYLSALGHWEMFSVGRQLKLPIELYIVPDVEHGNHPLQNPVQRLASEGGAVDWFDFWLNKHEDPDPRKSEQYRRWRELRVLYDRLPISP